jgi:hypothetical protein
MVAIRRLDCPAFLRRSETGQTKRRMIQTYSVPHSMAVSKTALHCTFVPFRFGFRNGHSVRVKIIPASQTQKLVRFQALCPTCHLVKHHGLAQSNGREEEARAQLCQVNNWTPTEVRNNVAAQFDQGEKHSRIEWKIDLSHLENHFGIFGQAENSAQRHERAETFLSGKTRRTSAGSYGRKTLAGIDDG